MTIWLLVMTLHFTLDSTSLELPIASLYQTHTQCRYTGEQLTQMLTQDFVTVTWVCVEKQREEL